MGLLALASATIAWFGRGRLFLHDEWGFIFYRRQGGFDTFLAAFHGHLFAGVLLIYRALFATVGLRHYGAYLGVALALHVLCAALLYRYTRRRGLHPVLSLLVLALFLFLGATDEVVFWLASAGFVIPMIAMLATLLVWDSQLRGANVLTAVLAVVALGSSSLGVAVVVGLGVCALGVGRSARRLAALGLPLAAWGAWFLAIRPHVLPAASLRKIPGAFPTGDVGSFKVSGSQISQLPSWIVHAAVGDLAGLAGKASWVEAGLVLGLASLALLAWAWNRQALGWRVAGLATSLVSFWILTGLTRAQQSSPSASRYLYPSAVLILMLAAECVRGVDLRAAVLVGVTAVMALALGVNVDQMHRNVTHDDNAFAREKVVLAQLEGCRGILPPTFVPSRNDIQGVVAGPFWAATATLGDPVPLVPRAHDPLCPAKRS